MKPWHLLLNVSARRLVPLLLVVFALSGMSLRYVDQSREIAREVVQSETTRLRERLSIEQTRLDLRLGGTDRLMVRRLVGALALHDGITRAFLVSPTGRVEASLARTDVGRPLEMVLEQLPERAGMQDLFETTLPPALAVSVAPGGEALRGLVPLVDGSRLTVWVDLTHPLLLRKAAMERELARELLAVLLAVLLLALLLHYLWFRRAKRLVAALGAIGAGQLDARAGLNGRDELALIGNAVDGMAQQLRDEQRALREQGEQLRLFYELPFIGMAVSSPQDKRWLRVNDRLCDMLGYTREELLKKTWAEMTPPGDLERNIALFDELVAGQRNGYQMRKRFLRKDGRTVHAEIDVRAVYNEDGSVGHLFTTIQDVTERIAAEEALRRSQTLLLEAQRIGRMGSWSHDLASGISDWTEEMRRLHQWGPGPRTEYLALVHPDDQPLLDQAFQAAASNGQPMDVHYRWITPGGELKHLRIQSEALWEQGRVVSLLGLVQDETELVLAQRERDRMITVMETSSDIVSMADPRGQVFYFNRAGYEVLGLTPGELPPDTITRIHPEWAAKRVLEEAFPAVMREGRWLGETAILDARGREVPMSQLIMAHRDADGRLEYAWTIMRDISERKAAEASIQLERARLAEAQSVARIGSWSVQLPEGVVTWSSEHYKVLGLDQERTEPSIGAYLSVVHPDDLARVQAHVKHVVDRIGAGMAKIEHRIQTPNGIRHVEERASLERDDQGQVVRLFGTTMDVTERVLADQAARELRDMLEQAEAVALLGSWTADAQTQWVAMSAQLFRNLGLEPAKKPPSAEVFLSCVHPDDQAMVAMDMEQMRRGQPVTDMVYRTHPARGPVRVMRRTVRRITRDEQGLKPRYIGTLQDITEAVQAEERLKEINLDLERRVAERTAQLSTANRELEAFSYTVSHDLKAPLRGIDGYSQLLDEEFGPQLGEEGRQFITRIRRGVQLMGELISDLLDYSRMERRTMERQQVELLPLVQRVLEGYAGDVERHRVQVNLLLEPMTLALDRDGMAVVLRNLIGNAIKFSRDHDNPIVEIGSRHEAGRRMLWVRDNGVGFDMKYHDRIFGIFQRLHRAEDYPGTGVGLALVAKAVERMGGRVWAHSEPGAGATFFMEFPQ